MSASSSSNRHLGKVASSAAQHSQHVPKKRQYRWLALLALPLWVLLTFVASQLIILFVVQVMDWVGVPLDSLVSGAVAQTLVAALVYALTLALAIGVPYALKQQRTTLEDLGLTRLVSWSDIGLAPVAFVIYGLLTTLFLTVVTTVFTGFPLDQAQDTGFTAFGSRLDNMLAFVTLVIIAPVAEEVLFRGYLYGKLKKFIPGIVAAIATSVLFAAVHLQWNVAVDVFVLSLILCGLRSLTGSIWAGILVHMIKNGIAYYILFVSPLIGG